MEIVIKIPEEIYFRIMAQKDYAYDVMRTIEAVERGKVLPAGHGRLVDADAFIDGLRDASKRQRYNECLIDEILTVDDVFQAVIESLENKGSAEGDAPTIIEADKEGEDADSN